MRRTVVGTLSRVNFGLAQAFRRRLRFYRRVVDLFERVRLRLGCENGHDLDVPVIILIQSLPVTQALRRVQAVGGSVQHEVEILGNGSNALQGTAQKRSE